MTKVYKIDVDCANCASKMEVAGSKVAGVASCEVNFLNLTMTVEFAAGADERQVMDEVLKACKKVEDDCEIFLDNDTESEDYEDHEKHDAHEKHECHCGCCDDDDDDDDDKDCHCGDHEHHHDHNHEHSHEHSHEHNHEHDNDDDDDDNPALMLGRIISSAVLVIAAVLLSHLIPGFPALAEAIICLVAYLIIGYDIVLGAVKGIFRGQFLDENFLMAVASIGAMAMGEFVEGCAVIIFYQIGEFFEDYAVGKSRKNIAALMDIRPDYANILQDGQPVKVDPNSVKIGSVIVVNPGEKIPIDGHVVSGSSALNTAALTGESLPVNVTAGDSVLSGSVNMTGILQIETEKAFGESTISKILNLVQESGAKKTKTENFIKKFARYYTPVVCLSALAIAILGPVITLLIGSDLTVGALLKDWIFRALTFLVVSCPCALVISIPLSFFAGIGCASHNGVLVKGSGYLEALSRVKTVVFDKTGTMTKGVFEVTGIHHNQLEEKELLALAAYAESASSHPIAKSIISYSGLTIDRSLVENVEEIGGNGIIATIKPTGIFNKYDSLTVAVGNDKLMKRIGVEPVPCHHIGTIVHVAVNGIYQGHIVISDVVKPTAKEAINLLHATGVTNTVMLTGDAKAVADRVASDLGIDEVHAELLPADKVTQVERLLASKPAEKATLAFVGDGINDAPVLSRADIGIAMGGLGSDAAIEAADVVLMDDDPAKIAKAINISKKALRIVYENIYLSIGIKVLCLIISALGIFGTFAMWIAIFADTGVLILAVLNAMRALHIRK